MSTSSIATLNFAVGIIGTVLSLLIPNLIGVILGSAQLTVYVMYKKKPDSAERATVALGLEKGDMVNVMELGAYNYEEAKLKDGAVKVVEKALKRVKSLPKPSLNREHTIRRFLKTLSFGTNNLPFTPQDEDVEVEIRVDAEEVLTFTPNNLTSHH